MKRFDVWLQISIVLHYNLTSIDTPLRFPGFQALSTVKPLPFPRTPYSPPLIPKMQSPPFPVRVTPPFLFIMVNLYAILPTIVTHIHTHTLTTPSIFYIQLLFQIGAIMNAPIYQLLSRKTRNSWPERNRGQLLQQKEV